MTEIYLTTGAAAAIAFMAIFMIEGALRAEYNSGHHMVSLLTLGRRGWIQSANFLLFGASMIAFAVGVFQVLRNVVGTILVIVFGVGAVASGLFVPDPLFGYPPGAPRGMPSEPSLHHRVHNIAGPIMFLSIFGAALSIARSLNGNWYIYTLATAIGGVIFTASLIMAIKRIHPKTGLIQRGLILVYWIWIVLLGFHLLNF